MITSNIDISKPQTSDVPKATGATEGVLLNDFSYVISKVHQDTLQRLDAVIKLSDGKTLALSTQFQTLSKNASLQAEYLTQLIDIAQTVSVGEDKASIQDVSALLHKTFLESINCMLEISKQAMLMVYILNDATKNLNEIEKSIRQIEVINHKTKYLSINATIEAVRAGEAGESFQVVASEVRDLSNDTQRLAINIRGQVNQMTETLMYAQEILEKVASIDMSTNMLAKEQLDEMMEGLIQNSEKIAHIAGDASKASQEFSNVTRQLVTDIQYQDRIRQDLEAIKKTVTTVGDVQKELGLPYPDAPPEAVPPSIIYTHVSDSSGQKISKIIEEEKEPFSVGMSAAETKSSDDVELF